MITIAGKDLTTHEEKMFRKWVNTLYAEKYPQGTHVLQSFIGLCCLGVGCIVAIPQKKRKVFVSGYLIGCVPKEQENAPAWLQNISDDFQSKTRKWLPSLNDYGGTDNNKVELQPFTHAEIAMLLDMVYILKVLD